MKNSYIALAVFSMAALMVSSCETVNEVNAPFVPGENEVVFTLGYNSIQTKSSDAGISTAKVSTMDLGKYGNTNFYLEESVVNLDGFSAGPETKGTPAYTENLGVLYGEKLGVYGIGGNFDSAGEVTYSKYIAEGDNWQLTDGGWQYIHKYDSDPWPTSGSAQLYFRMPNDDSNVSVTGRSDGQITFTYTSPAASTDQNDILFGYRTATKSDYEASIESGGLPILLKHALTGVKFAAGNPDDVTIKSISLAGLYNSGTCVIAPSAEEGNYTDIIGNHSSAGDVTWTFPETPSTGTFTNSYTGTVNFGTSTSTEEGVVKKFPNKGNYPDSFAANGGKNNLNNSDASQTFWFIPQDFGTATDPREVTLTVTYSLKGSTTNETPLVINLGELFANRGVEWQAGELYTYTLRIDEVNVRIEDTVTKDANNGGSDGDPRGILGSTKDAVKITNTGNTDVFIRAAISGQWVYDQEVNSTTHETERVIMFGFTDDINQLYLVESWYEDQFVSNAGEHGVFEDLAGYKNIKYSKDYTSQESVNGWVYNPVDKYYYYTLPVAVGADTAPLFTSYTIKKIPHARNSGKVMVTNMYFTLEIATQAINARTDNGTKREDYAQAWVDARRIDDSAVVHTDVTTGGDETGDGE